MRWDELDLDEMREEAGAGGATGFFWKPYGHCNTFHSHSIFYQIAYHLVLSPAFSFSNPTCLPKSKKAIST